MSATHDVPPDATSPAPLEASTRRGPPRSRVGLNLFWRTFFLLGVLTGMRCEEIAGIEVGAGRKERKEAYLDRMDAKEEARQELWQEREAGHWTDPANE